MTTKSRRLALSVAALLLIVGGVLVPIAVLSQVGAYPDSKAQLQTMVGLAEGSQSYASGLIAAANLHSLDTTAASAQLSAGSAFLTTAQSDLSSSSNFTGGTVAAQEAMNDFTQASTDASVLLVNGGFASTVDVAAAQSAISETNETIAFEGSVAAVVCSTSSGSITGLSAFTQACTSISSNITSASTHLAQAAVIVAQFQAGANASANLSSATLLIVQAKNEASDAASSLLGISGYTYAQRGQLFVDEYLNGLYAKANSTVSEQQAVLANLTQFLNSYEASAAARNSSVASVVSSVSDLSASISTVTNASTAVEMATLIANDAGGNFTGLGDLVANVSAAAALTNAIASAQANVSSYVGAAGAVGTENGLVSGTSLPNFGAEEGSYLSALVLDQSEVQSAGEAYLLAYTDVQLQLQALITSGQVTGLLLSELISYESTLTTLGLAVSSSVSGLNSSLSAEISAMPSITLQISSVVTAVDSGTTAIQVSPTDVTMIAEISIQESSYLNSTATGSLSQAAAEVQSVASNSSSFLVALEGSAQGTLGAFIAAEASNNALAAKILSLSSGSVSAVAAATGFVAADVQTRQTEIASANSDISQGLTLLASQEIDAGVAAMAQSSVEFQTASAMPAS